MQSSLTTAGHGSTVNIYLSHTQLESDAGSELAPAASAAAGPVVQVVQGDPVVRDFAVAACRAA